jgi:hypothetical protein
VSITCVALPEEEANQLLPDMYPPSWKASDEKGRPPTPHRCLCPGALHLWTTKPKANALRFAGVRVRCCFIAIPPMRDRQVWTICATISALKGQAGLPNESTAKKLGRGQKSEAPTAMGPPRVVALAEALQKLPSEARVGLEIARRVLPCKQLRWRLKPV